MKKLLRLLLLLPILSLFAPAQQTYDFDIGGLDFLSGASIPASCARDGSKFWLNTGSIGWYTCKSNAWVIDGSGAGGGTVTQVNTGTGLTGGPCTTTCTISLANTTVTPGSYTNTNLTVDQQGRITAAANGSGGGGLGDPGNSGIVFRTTLNTTRISTSTDIIAPFSGCTGLSTQFLGADGGCHIANGAPAAPTNSVQFNANPGFGGVLLGVGQTLVAPPTAGAPIAQYKIPIDLRDYNTFGDMCQNAVGVASAKNGAYMIFPCGKACVGGANIHQYCESTADCPSSSCAVSSYTNQQACSVDPTGGLWTYNAGNGNVTANGGKIEFLPVNTNGCVIALPASGIHVGKGVILEAPYDAAGDGDGVYFANNANFDAEAAKRVFTISAVAQEGSDTNCATYTLASNPTADPFDKYSPWGGGSVELFYPNLGVVDTQNAASGSCPSNCVTWDSGTQFTLTWTGTVIINNVRYTIGTVFSATLLSLTTAPGLQTTVNYTKTNGHDDGKYRVISGNNPQDICSFTQPHNSAPYSFTVYNPSFQACSGGGTSCGNLTAVFPTPAFGLGPFPWDAVCTGGNTCPGTGTQQRCVTIGGGTTNGQCLGFRAQIHNIGVLAGGFGSKGEEAYLNVEGEEGSHIWADGSMPVRTPYGIYEQATTRSQNTLGINSIEDYCNNNLSENCGQGENIWRFGIWVRDIINRNGITNMTGNGGLAGGGILIDGMGQYGASVTKVSQIHEEDYAIFPADCAICIGTQFPNSGVEFDTIEWTSQSGKGSMYQIGSNGGTGGGGGNSSDVLILNSAYANTGGASAGHINNTQSNHVYQDGNIAFYVYHTGGDGVTELSSSAEFKERMDGGINVANNFTVDSAGNVVIGGTCTGCGGTSLPANARILGSNALGTAFIVSDYEKISQTLSCNDFSGSGTTQSCSTTVGSALPTASDCLIYNTTTPNLGSNLTINVNGAGAQGVEKWSGTPLQPGDILPGHPYLMCFNISNNKFDLMTSGNPPAVGCTVNCSYLLTTEEPTGTNVGAAQPVAANVIHFMRFYNVTSKQLGATACVNVVATDAAKHVDVGVYSISGTTLTRVWHTGALLTTSPGGEVCGTSLATTMIQGGNPYYIAYCSDSTVATVSNIAPGVGGSTSAGSILAGGAGAPAHTFGTDSTDVCAFLTGLPGTANSNNITNATTNVQVPLTLMIN